MAQFIRNISFGEGPYFTFCSALENYEKYCIEQVEIDPNGKYKHELKMTQNMLKSLHDGTDVLSEMCWD